MIVIDVGCANYEDDNSIVRLIERFHPTVLYGFDPNRAILELPSIETDTNVILRVAAAWTYDGEVGLLPSGSTSSVSDAWWAPKVECFDLARFIRDLPPDEPIVLKLDAEKSEYALLEHLIRTRTDELLSLALVEWHCFYCDAGGEHRHYCKHLVDRTGRRQLIEDSISCELKEWNW